MRRFVWGSCAIAALALGTLSAHAQQVIGVSAAVKNDVRNRKQGAPLPRPVQVKDRIALADQLQTGAQSQLQVLLLDKSVFTVGANARLTVDKYVYDPSSNSRSLGATVARGAFRFMSGAPDRGTGSQIHTPIATIGIRGTIVEGVVGVDAALIAAGENAVGRGVRSDPDTASLIVLRGPGNVTQGRILPGSITVTAGGRTVPVDRPMLAVYVPGPGMAPIGPFRISPSALSQIQALLYPSVAQRLGLLGPADNLGTGEARGTYFPPPRGGPDYPEQPPGGFPPGGLPRGGGVPGVGVPGFGTPAMPNLPQGGFPQRPRAAGGTPARGAGNVVQGNGGAPANNIGGGGTTPPRGRLGSGGGTPGTQTTPVTNNVTGAPANNIGGTGTTPPRGKLGGGGGTTTTNIPTTNTSTGTGKGTGAPSTNVPGVVGNPTGGKPTGNPGGGNPTGASLTGGKPSGTPTPTPTPPLVINTKSGPSTNVTGAPGNQPGQTVNLPGKGTPTPKPTPRPTPKPTPSPTPRRLP